MIHFRNLLKRAKIRNNKNIIPTKKSYLLLIFYLYPSNITQLSEDIALLTDKRENKGVGKMDAREIEM